MTLCRTCDGPITKCERCRRWHCDDEACTEMPLDCARWAQNEEAH